METGERPPRYRRRSGPIPPFDVTLRDEIIILIVARHRFIRSKQIVDLLKADDPTMSEQNIVRRLRHLLDGNFIRRVTIPSDKTTPGSKPVIYALGNKGIDLLAAKYGFRRPKVDYTSNARTAKAPNIEHALEVTNFMVALAIACHRHGHLEIIYFDQIMRDLAPREMQKRKNPYSWPVSVRPMPNRWQGRVEKTLYAIPDRIFGVRNLAIPGAVDQNCKFYFLEADRSTMPVESTDFSKSSLLRKLVLYGFTYRDELPEKYYGLPHFRVLTVVASRQRIGTILATHKRYTERLVPAPLCLFAERPGLFAAEDFFDYPWVDAAGKPHRLLD